MSVTLSLMSLARFCFANPSPTDTKRGSVDFRLMMAGMFFRVGREYKIATIVHTNEGLRKPHDAAHLEPLTEEFASRMSQYLEPCRNKEIVDEFKRFMTETLAKDKRYADYKWSVRHFCLE